MTQAVAAAIGFRCATAVQAINRRKAGSEAVD
jgi:hypothetical protein